MVYGWLAVNLFPERCPGCGGSSVRGFCGPCAAEFARIADPCAGCGLPRPVAVCPRLTGEWRVQQVLAPFRYGLPLAHHLLALKFRGARGLGRALGLLLAATVTAMHAQSGVDAIVPVPLHRRRLIERGYNQAFEIARALSSELGLPMVTGVRRRIATPAQSMLPADVRRRNVTGVFEVGARLRGRRVAVVDDVVTTGATVNALAVALGAAGASVVTAWALARTLPGERDQPRNT